MHIFLAALPLLPLHAANLEADIAAALAQGAVTIMRKHGAHFRHAAVAEWEVRLRVLDGHDPWRMIVSTPTGKLAQGQKCNDAGPNTCILSMAVKLMAAPVVKGGSGCEGFG